MQKRSGAAQATTLLFMFRTQATAGPQTVMRSGARHAITVFATGVDRASAQAVGLDHLGAHGWTDLAQCDVRAWPDGARAIVDPVMRDAAREAERTGAAFVIHAEEIER